MLIKLHNELTLGCGVTVEKRILGRDVSLLGAFPIGSDLNLRLTVPRALGVRAVVLRLCRDGEEDRDLAFSFHTSSQAQDVYTLTLSSKELSPAGESGLFYYEYLLLRGWDTLFSDTQNNVDLTFSEKRGRRFRLSLYEKDFKVPSWFGGGIMYHIFLDRFCRGKGKAEPHTDAILDPDWENGIPQYAPVPGAPLSNNVFFGGNLWGVAEKLEYLSSLGVTVLYLSPIFKAYSNHRYDTADYEEIDPLLGGEEAFCHLLKSAHERGIRVILDGVFNHTGDDSKYFNRRGNYPSLGAYQSKDSPYASWYTFREFPNRYECWWDIVIMPRLNHKNEDCRRYFTGKNGIIAHWLAKGADGWRLDVADELSDAFLDELRARVKETNPEGMIIGEVWENASDKIAYGHRRRYFGGRQLDSVMNYPLRDAILAFLERGDADTFYNTVTELYASYPPFVSCALMNLLGTHDTERILTRLGDGTKGEGSTNEDLSRRRLSPKAKKEAVTKLMLASAIQFTVFGVPSVYYGDEVGLEGYHDPFCRMPFPWGRENSELLCHYRTLAKIRHSHPSLADGDFRFVCHGNGFFAYERSKGTDTVRLLANIASEHTFPLEGRWCDALTNRETEREITLSGCAFRILYKKK